MEYSQVIYCKLLDESELLNACNRQTALLLCQHIQPQVCLARSVLVERNSIATHLFLLHRGSLHVTLGDEKDREKGRKSKAREVGSERDPPSGRCPL